MQLLFLLFLVCYSKKLFEKDYTLDKLDLNYIFEESHGYIVQLDILEFPKNKNCFPVLELHDENGKSTTSSYESYSQKQIQQRVWLTEREKSENQTIRIYCMDKSIYSPNMEKCEMFFKLTIFENVELLASKPCNFPMFGPNCEKAFMQFDIDLLIEVTVKQQSWFQAYYELGNLDYQLKLTNPNKLMGVSLVLGSINNIGHLPSFFDNYILIKEKQTKSINLKEYFEHTDQANYYILIGIYNENNQSDQQMIIEMNLTKVYEFPIWAVLSIASIVIIGVLIVVYIYYSYKKKYREITYVKPVIEKAILDTYMPALKMNKDYTKLECSICLIQFEMADKYRITPCNHLFHDECLQDWTKKNGNCPLCRQGFKEEEIKIFCEKLNSNTNDSQMEMKKETTTHFMKLSNTDITQNNRSVNSPQHQLCQSESGRKTSVLVIQDEVIE